MSCLAEGRVTVKPVKGSYIGLPKLSKNRAVERQGVNAVKAFFEANDCVFQDVSQENDFGKDAYVDIGLHGALTPFCVALQIKSGNSYKDANGNYRIPVKNHSEVWRRSTIPVFGIVYDVLDKALRWVDLTGYLRTYSEHVQGYVLVHKESILDKQALETKFRKVAASYALEGGDSLILNLLTNNDQEKQISSILDAGALGRHDPRYMIILRRLLAHYDREATQAAIWVLGHATSHPDIFFHKDNWIPTDKAKIIQTSFRWSENEINQMISAIEVDEWGRGTLGQSLDMLLQLDPDILDKLRYVIGSLIRYQKIDHAVRAVTIALSYSSDARVELKNMLKLYPSLAQEEWIIELRQYLNEFGFFSLYA